LKNPHGGGLHNVDTGETFKSMSVDEVVEKAMKQPKESRVIVHFRYATRGKKDVSNLQPVMTRFGSLSMNGTLTGNQFFDKDKSDTIIFAEMLQKMATSWDDFRPLKALGIFEDSRFVVATKNDIVIVNEEDGVWRNSCWNSKPSTYDSVIPLFVYGTLRKGYWNHYSYLASSLFVGEALTVKEFTLYVSGIPYMVEPKGDLADRAQIKGEVYFITKDELEEIDSLEGHPTSYKREPIMVTVDNKEIEVLAYLYQYIPEGKITDDFTKLQPKPKHRQYRMFGHQSNYHFANDDEEDIEYVELGNSYQKRLNEFFGSRDDNYFPEEPLDDEERC